MQSSTSLLGALKILRIAALTIIAVAVMRHASIPTPVHQTSAPNSPTNWSGIMIVLSPGFLDTGSGIGFGNSNLVVDEAHAE